MPLAPLTVTLKGPMGPNVEVEIDSVDDAVPLGPKETIEGVSELVGPKLGMTCDARATFPMKPLRLVTVIVDVPDVPACIVRKEGIVLMTKSAGRDGGKFPLAESYASIAFQDAGRSRATAVVGSDSW